MMKINLPDFSFIWQYQENSLTMILCCLCLGIAIAAAAVLYRQCVLGGIINKIIERSAFDEASSLSFTELGYSKKNVFSKLALRKNSTFRKLLATSTRENGETAFYLEKEKAEQLKNRFNKKGNSPLALVIGIILFLVAAFFCLTIIPMFIEKIKAIFK